MSESDNDFMKRLQKEQDERREAGSQFEESVWFNPEPNELYRLIINKAYGKVDDTYGDFMVFSFDPSSPVKKGHKGNENTMSLRRGMMRTLRQRVFRDLPDSPDSPDLESGRIGEDPILVKYPQIDEPVMVQFIVDESEPKGSNTRGFLQIYGEVVDNFPKKWDDPATFLQRMKDERQQYLDDKRSSGDSDEGEKLSGKEIGLDKPIHLWINRAYPPREEKNWMIFQIDKEKSELRPDLEKGKYNRTHMNGIALKTFLNISKLPPRENSPLIQVGYDTEKDQPEYVKVPQIPEGGIGIRFFRKERKGKTHNYIECLGEVVK